MTGIEKYLAEAHPLLTPQERGNVMWRRIACDQIASTESKRSHAYQRACLEHPHEELWLFSADDKNFIMGWMQELGNDTVAQLDFALSEPLVHTSTLSSIPMHARWDKDDGSADIFQNAPDVLSKYGYNSVLFDRETRDAKRRIAVVAGMLPGFPQMVAIQHKRLMLATDIQTHNFILKDGRQLETQTSVEIDNLSWCALDIDELDALKAESAREVRLIVVCSMITDPHPGDEEIILRKMADYDFTREEIEARLQSQESTVVREPETLRFVEDAIYYQSPLLARAVTTHPYERKLHSFKITS